MPFNKILHNIIYKIKYINDSSFESRILHPDPKLYDIYIPSHINRVISSDGSNFYFRESSNKEWMLTKGWSLAMNEILYGNPSNYIHYIMTRNEYIAKHCMYKKTSIGYIPIYITHKSKL